MKQLTYAVLALVTIAVSGCQSYRLRIIAVQGDSQAMEQLFKNAEGDLLDIDWDARLAAFKRREGTRIVKRATMFVSLGEREKEVNLISNTEVYLKQADEKSMIIDFDSETKTLVGRNGKTHLYATQREQRKELVLPFEKWVPVGTYKPGEKRMMDLIAEASGVRDFKEVFSVTFVRATPNCGSSWVYYSIP